MAAIVEVDVTAPCGGKTAITRAPARRHRPGAPRAWSRPASNSAGSTATWPSDPCATPEALAFTADRHVLRIQIEPGCSLRRLSGTRSARFFHSQLENKTISQRVVSIRSAFKR